MGGGFGVLWEVLEGERELEITEVDFEEKESEVDLGETVVAIESPLHQLCSLFLSLFISGV